MTSVGIYFCVGPDLKWPKGKIQLRFDRVATKTLPKGLNKEDKNGKWRVDQKEKYPATAGSPDTLQPGTLTFGLSPSCLKQAVGANMYLGRRCLQDCSALENFN